MEAFFETLKNQGKNSVDNLVKWMQEASIIGKDKAAEENVKKLFEDVTDKKDVPLDQFKRVVSSVASDQEKSPDDLLDLLSKETPKSFESAAAAAAKAVGGALKNAFSFK